MRSSSLIFRSVRYYLRSNLGTLAGAAVAAAALTGALAVGDSLRASLRQRALQRLGWVRLAMAPQDRFFTRNLTQVFTNRPATAALALMGTAAREEDARANHVNIYGIAADFLEQAPAPGQVFINQALAEALGAKQGDELLLRVPKPSALSREVAVSPHNEQSIGLRLTIGRVLSAVEMGDFSLRASQIPPRNAFVGIDELAATLDLTDKSNLLLLGSRSRNDAALDVAEPAQLLHRITNSAALGIDLRLVPGAAAVELRSERIFLDPELARAAEQVPAPGTNAAPEKILTYLANLFQHGTNTTPYSMITAAGPPFTPADLRDDEIVLSGWLAEDLHASTGDAISVSYFAPESGARLATRTNVFKVRGVVPRAAPWADRTLMPEFPGIENAESTSDWDGGFPLVYKIRPKDETYWKAYRGTPKAFVSLAAGQRMWHNRFGDLTAIRWPVPEGLNPEAAKAAIEGGLLAKINPAALGLRFEPVRAQALNAASQSQDFGQLFLGFSFFLICAALLLMALLFRFSIESRAAEAGTLLAVGWTGKQVRQTLVAEGSLIALAGVALGLPLGVLYAKAMLLGLTTIWRGATGTGSLRFAFTPASCALGFCASAIVAVATLWLSVRNQAKRPATELLAGSSGVAVRTSGRLSLVLGVLSALVAIATVGWAIAAGQTQNPEVFFSSGTLLVIAGLALTAALLGRLGRAGSSAALSINSLALRGAARRRSRTVATVALLASGCFVVSSISVFRQDASKSGTNQKSGTGGFALLGELTQPLVQDLNSSSGLEAFALSPSQLPGTHFVQIRVHQGDDASCLNLNQAQRPRVLGVRPQDLRGRFTFSSVLKGLPPNSGWDLLQSRPGPAAPARQPEEVPAIGDANSIQWALHKKVGDTIDYPAEDGHLIRLRLVAAVENSILQGSLLIDEEAFLKYFPGESGYRLLLIDAPAAQTAQISTTLARAFRDLGLELTPAARRLNEFNAVQNTYLGTFQLLGGIGLLLGSAGLGVVVLRNVLERRSELAVLAAVGFNRRQIHRLVLKEHLLLLALGLLIGLISAAVAVLPTLLSPSRSLALLPLLLTIAAVLANGLLWTWLATRRTLRGQLLSALRNE